MGFGLPGLVHGGGAPGAPGGKPGFGPELVIGLRHSVRAVLRRGGRVAAAEADESARQWAARRGPNADEAAGSDSAALARRRAIVVECDSRPVRRASLGDPGDGVAVRGGGVRTRPPTRSPAPAEQQHDSFLHLESRRTALVRGPSPSPAGGGVRVETSRKAGRTNGLGSRRERSYSPSHAKQLAGSRLRQIGPRNRIRRDANARAHWARGAWIRNAVRLASVASNIRSHF